MKKYTYLILIFVAVGIAASVLFAVPAMEAGAQQADPDTAQEPIPAPWPEEPGAMPELIGGAKADRPMVFIEPETSSNDRQSADDDITINVWYGESQSFGQIGNPQQWVNILGNVSSPFGVQSLTYTYQGVEKPLTIGPGKPRNPRLVNPGDFNIEIDYATLNAGANVIKLKATEGITGDVKEQNVTVYYTQNKVWPEDYTANWATASKIEDVAQIVDGKWAIEGGKLIPKEVGYDRLVAIGEMEYPAGAPTVWKEYEVRVPITVNGLDESGFEGVSNGPGIGLLMRWQGQTQKDPADPDQPALDWARTGALGWYRWQEKDGAEGLELRGHNWTGGTSTAKVWEFGVEYIMKMSVQQATSGDLTKGYYRLKFWKAGTKEPVSWDLQSFSSTNNSPSGSVVLIAHHVDAEFGNVTVKPLKGMSFQLTANSTGSGAITVKTDPPGQTIFQYGDVARVLAVPAANNILDSWSGDLSLPGTVNPLVLSMTSDVNVTANFKEALPGKLTVKIQGEGTVVKDPDKDQYNGGEFVTLTATPKPGNIFAGWEGDLVSTLNPATIQIAGDKTVTAKFISVGEASPISDDFNQCELDTALWQFVNPAGDGSVNSTGTTVQINVPAGNAHGMWPTINRNAPRIMQSTKNQDFTIQVKFNSIPTKNIQIEGLLVEQDANNYLRFDIWSDGNALKMFAGGLVGGSTQAKSAIIPTGGSTLSTIYMRVSRVGDTWTQAYSFDGATWQGSQGFVQALTVNSTGIFGANEPKTGAPAWMVEADYFINTAFPVGNTGYLLTTDVVGNGAIELSPEPDINGRYGCNQVVSLKAVPEQDFTGWSGALSGTTNPAKLTMNANKSVTAYFGSEPVKGACTQIGSSQNGVCMPVVLNKYSQK